MPTNADAKIYGQSLANDKWLKTSGGIFVPTDAPSGGSGGGGSSGGSGGSFTFWDPDKPPTTPHVFDNEGEGTAGDAVTDFTAYNAAAGQTFKYDGKSRMELFVPGGTGDVLRFMYKTAPAGESWTITTKLNIRLSGNYNAAGLCVRDPVTGKMLLWGEQMRTGGNESTRIWTWWTNSTTWAGETLGNWFVHYLPAYFQLSWDNATSTLTGRLSKDGKEPLVVFQSSNTWFTGGAPVQVGLAVNPQSGGDAYAYFDFWRYKAATTDPTLGGMRSVGSGSTVVLPDMDLVAFWPSSAVKATASSSYSATPPIGLFLRMAGATAGWLTNAASTGWAKIEFPSPVVVKSYAIAPWSVDTYPSRTPKTWTFEGSNDDANWTVLDTQTNFLAWSQFQRVAFTTANTVAYKFYRINVTANQGDTYMGMGGLYLYGQPVASNASTASPDIPPATPNAMDDECNGVSLDTKWTIVDPSGITASVTKEYGNNSWMSFSCPSSVQNRIFAITQPAPAGNYKIRSRLAFDSATGSYFGIQLIARRASVTKSVVAGPMYHSSYGMQTMYATRINEPSTLLTDTDLYEIRHDIFYLELEYDGTNLIWRQSTTGAKYTRFYQETVATHLGAAPESVGVNFHFYGASSDANHTMVASMDWFRRVA